MSESSVDKVRAAMARAQAQADAEAEKQRQGTEYHDRLRAKRDATVDRLCEGVLQVFLEAMAKHGNPGLQPMYVFRGPPSAMYLAHSDKKGWQLYGGRGWEQLWICPDGTGVGGQNPQHIVPLHEAIRTFLVCKGFSDPSKGEFIIVQGVGEVLQRHNIKL